MSFGLTHLSACPSRACTNPQFLAQFADETLFGPLARLQLAAGELPQARQLFARRALGDQHAPVDVDERDGDDGENPHER